jgi:hypothetical protein
MQFGFGQFLQDDVLQFISLVVIVIALSIWIMVMRHSQRPLLFLPPMVALAGHLVFYIIILVGDLSIADATFLSATRTLQDVLMWTISGGVMWWFIRNRKSIS